MTPEQRFLLENNVCTQTVPTVSDSLVTLYVDLLGIVASYSCLPGHHLIDGGISKSIVCFLQGGSWPSVLPRCTGLFSVADGIALELQQCVLRAVS
jgi:hypothetical protein